MVSQHRALWALHGAVFLFGCAGLFGKFLTVSALVLVFGRTFFAALVLWPAARFQRVSLKPGSLKDQGALVITGVLLAVHWLTFFQAIIVSSVALGLLTFSSFPLFVTLLEPLIFKERLRRMDLGFAALVALGLVLVTPSLDFGDTAFQGALWGVASGFTFALLSLFNRAYVRKHPPQRVAFHQNVFAALTLLPFMGAASIPPPAELVWLAVLGIFCTALAHALFIGALKHLKAGLASVTTCLEPVYGIILAWLFFGEQPGLRLLLGGAVILGATVLATRFRKPSEQAA